MAVQSGAIDSLIKTAEEVVERHGAVRVNGKIASLRTIEISKQVMRESCHRLHGLGFYLSDISSLKEKHIHALVRDWHATGSRSGKPLANKTMQNQLSRLRIFAGWLGKPGIVKPGGLAAYLPEVEASSLRVRTYTERSKSWTGNGVDLVKIIGQARLEDERVWAMLLMGVAFGLRKKEMLRIEPWRADALCELRIDGSVAKNGRARSIPLIGAAHPYGLFQRWCLDQAKRATKRGQTLGWPDLSFKQSENRFYHFMKKLGVTHVDSGISPHGLRAEFAENMALIRGLVPPSLGGDIDQMGKAQRLQITDAITSMLGHNEDHTIKAYFSSFYRPLAHVGGIGGKVGPTIPLDREQDIFVTVHVNPAPVRARDGSYRVQSLAERTGTAVTCVLEQPPQDDQHFDVVSFLAEYPQLAGRIRKTLVAVGLGDESQTS